MKSKTTIRTTEVPLSILEENFNITINTDCPVCGKFRGWYGYTIADNRAEVNYHNHHECEEIMNSKLYELLEYE